MEASGGTALGIEVNVRDHEAVETMMTRVVQEWAGWDVLVANAGGGRGRPMDTKASTLDPALLQLVVEMNLYGTVYSCNAAAPIMKQQRSGKIIAVSSVCGNCTIRRWMIIAVQRRGTSAPAVTIGGRPLEHARARGQLGQS